MPDVMEASPLAIKIWQVLKRGGTYDHEDIRRQVGAPSKAAFQRALEELDGMNLISMHEEDV